MRKKPKLTKKQKRTLENVRKNRQIDSNKLRLIIEEKRKWSIAELKKGQLQMDNLKINMTRLEGILLFIKDLTDPIKKEEK